MSKDAWDEVWSSMVGVVRKCRTKKEADELLKGLLSGTEQVMIAKRLMAMVLILSNWGSYEIAEILKLSNATVYKIQLQLMTNKSMVDLVHRLVPNKIPPSKRYKSKGALEKLMSDIFHGRRERSRLIYG